MAQPIVVGRSTRFYIRYSTQELLKKVAPFIQSVAEHVARSDNLEESVLKSVDCYPDAAKYFVVEPGKIIETFRLQPQHLYAEYRPRVLGIDTGDCSYELELSDTPRHWDAVKRLLELSSAGIYSKTAVRSQLSPSTQELFDFLLENGAITEQELSLPEFAQSSAPGVHRLQHASLLFRSKKMGILVDPHLHSSYRPSNVTSDIYKDMIKDKVDLILISHFHEDHFFLATLLMFPRDTPIVVPKVPMSTIICGDMVKLLQRFGFTNVIAVDWYSPALRFEDVDVHVLPFFGEQPLRFEPANDAALRNWGNTYAIRTESYLSWFLIDSGADALGSMLEVADYVRSRIGRVDILLSNLRRFPIWSWSYINGGLNWLTLAPRQMRDFKHMKDHCITLGPGGVAEICKILDARYYLPYAHWWGNLGRAARSSVDTPGQEELSLVRELGDSIRKIGANTRIVHWKIGDRFIAHQGERFLHEPIAK
jgi:L-ascorbate metabolism protein UlaG (beta-lactamase superfamily)